MVSNGYHLWRVRAETKSVFLNRFDRVALVSVRNGINSATVQHHLYMIHRKFRTDQQEHQIVSCLVHHIMFKVVKLCDSLQYDKSSTWHHVEFRWILAVWRILSTLCLPEQTLTCTLAGTEHLIHNVRLSTWQNMAIFPYNLATSISNSCISNSLSRIVTKIPITMKRALSLLGLLCLFRGSFSATVQQASSKTVTKISPWGPTSEGTCLSSLPSCNPVEISFHCFLNEPKKGRPRGVQYIIKQLFMNCLWEIVKMCQMIHLILLNSFQFRKANIGNF